MESIDTQRLITRCRDRDLILGSFSDKAGNRWLSILSDGELVMLFDDGSNQFRLSLDLIVHSAARVICWDSRELMSFGVNKIIDTILIYDVRLLYGGDRDLRSLSKDLINSVENKLIEHEYTLDVNIKAAESAGINVNKHSIMRTVPRRLVCWLVSSRLDATRRLFDLVSTDDLAHYGRVIWPYANVIRRIVKNGVRVDDSYMRKMLDSGNMQVPEDRFFKATMSQSRDGYVYTDLNPCGGKTGRIKVAGGFNCMGIPNGKSRKTIISRHDGGSICSFDFNAIDYRCIVQSIDDIKLRESYAGANDFHTRTTELLFGKKNVNDMRRKVIKTFTYVYAYGGSESTLSSKTGLSVTKVRDIMSRMNTLLMPIMAFREKLCIDALSTGYITRQDGGRTLVKYDDHHGKILGLYAQSFSSYIFANALMSVDKIMRDRKSKIIFTVHDELVVDLHPDEYSLINDIVNSMENAVNGYEFKVGVKKGISYGELSDYTDCEMH